MRLFEQLADFGKLVQMLENLLRVAGPAPPIQFWLCLNSPGCLCVPRTPWSSVLWGSRINREENGSFNQNLK